MIDASVTSPVTGSTVDIAAKSTFFLEGPGYKFASVSFVNRTGVKPRILALHSRDARLKAIQTQECKRHLSGTQEVELHEFTEQKDTPPHSVVCTTTHGWWHLG